MRLTKSEKGKRGEVIAEKDLLEEIIKKKVIIIGEDKADKKVIAL